MKVKYMAALAAASVFGMTALTACGPSTTEPDATGEVAPDATGEVAPDAAADPCAAEPGAAEPTTAPQ